MWPVHVEGIEGRRLTCTLGLRGEVEVGRNFEAGRRSVLKYFIELDQ